MDTPLKNLRRMVCATVTLPAFHNWPGAPEDVGYLASRHRHLLTVRVWVRTDHGDREVEFHQLQRRVRAVLFSVFPSPEPGEIELGARSCEHVAEVLFENAAALCVEPDRIEVWEDNENGATVFGGGS